MASEKTPTYTDHDGYKLASGFPLDGFRSGLEYEAKDEDLFIVTYPKVIKLVSSCTCCRVGIVADKMLTLCPIFGHHDDEATASYLMVQNLTY